jgi:hypothetical protein
MSFKQEFQEFISENKASADKIFADYSSLTLDSKTEIFDITQKLLIEKVVEKIGIKFKEKLSNHNYFFDEIEKKIDYASYISSRISNNHDEKIEAYDISFSCRDHKYALNYSVKYLLLLRETKINVMNISVQYSSSDISSFYDLDQELKDSLKEKDLSVFYDNLPDNEAAKTREYEKLRHYMSDIINSIIYEFSAPLASDFGKMHLIEANTKKELIDMHKRFRKLVVNNYEDFFNIAVNNPIFYALEIIKDSGRHTYRSRNTKQNFYYSLQSNKDNEQTVSFKKTKASMLVYRHRDPKFSDSKKAFRVLSEKQQKEYLNGSTNFLKFNIHFHKDKIKKIKKFKDTDYSYIKGTGSFNRAAGNQEDAIITFNDLGAFYSNSFVNDRIDIKILAEFLQVYDLYRLFGEVYSDCFDDFKSNTFVKTKIRKINPAKKRNQKGE